MVADESFNAYSRDPRQQVGRASESAGAGRLQELAPGIALHRSASKPRGQDPDVPLAKIGGKGLFVKEIEDALLNGEIDLAVTAWDADGTAGRSRNFCVPPREDPRDALITRDGTGWTS